jgi:hypothetical protein
MMRPVCRSLLFTIEYDYKFDGIESQISMENLDDSSEKLSPEKVVKNLANPKI